MNPRVGVSIVGWLITAGLIGVALFATDETPIDVGARLLATIAGAFTLAMSFLAAADVTSSALSRHQHPSDDSPR
jgi:hypothetical protein